MKKMFFLLIMISACYSMEPVEEHTFKEPTRQIAIQFPPDDQAIPIELNTDNIIIRSRAGTISSEESQFEEQINELMTIFSSVQKIEDEQYVNAVLEVLSRDRKETYHNISPYLSRRLRESYNEVVELTEARKKSSLKKLMKQLVADSINDAFVKMHQKREEQEAIAAVNARRSRILKKIPFATSEEEKLC
jgi:2,3-bisphosphoglycerate-independent phosphoglycerate mutase